MLKDANVSVWYMFIHVMFLIITFSAVDITTVWHDALHFAMSCFVSLQGMVAVCSLLVLMRKTMRKQMPFMIPLIGEWMIGEKREGNYVWQQTASSYLQYMSGFSSSFNSPVALNFTPVANLSIYG